MFRRIDTISGLAALGLHVAIALFLISVPPPKARSSTTVEVEVQHKPPPPPVTQPKPPEPEPEKKVVPKVKNAPAPTPSPEPPKDVPPPKQEVKPIYEVKEVVEGESSVAVQQGNNGSKFANPNEKGPSVPLPGGNSQGAPQATYKPVSDVYVKTLPEIDGEACAKTVAYPQEAEAQGIEGEVKLRVWLEDTGKVHDIKVLKGLGFGLDQAAVNALKHKCHFKPAVGTDGKPVPYEIKEYTWTFELPR
jgi:protein TonB